MDVPVFSASRFTKVNRIWPPDHRRQESPPKLLDVADRMVGRVTAESEEDA